MADIQVRSAFVDKVLVGTDGAWGLKTSEPHSRKNDAGGYDTTGRTFRTLRGRNIDWSHFQEKDRITFFGREETVEREHEGKKYYDLIVWVDAAAVINSQQATAQPARPAQSAPATTQTDAWTADAPF
ncbi:hypothetical protein [Delftia lacustris]|uniref:hypothetical protein n=1 Tax=Delftia lacustris TaxID=558537 RepID=UPI0006408CD5|nr:hypothetical protein [Delftia lacustris]